MEIRTSYEGKRGCGYRQPGGKYIVSGGVLALCDRLPVEVDRCPTCQHGIKLSRSWTWIDADVTLEGKPCERTFDSCPYCVICEPSKIGRAGLLWIGEKFYPTPVDWIAEAQTMGVSRRLAQIPHGFKVGETLVLVAHRKAIPSYEIVEGLKKDLFKPGIFHAFVPQAIEYIVRDEDSAEKLEKLEKQGIQLVKVVRVGETPALPTSDQLETVGGAS